MNQPELAFTLRPSVLRKLMSLRQVLLALACSLFMFFAALGAYAVFWSAWYRLPRGSSETIDMRKDKLSAKCYVTFCSSLANNPHGFPGHAYIVWATESNAELRECESLGFVPSSLVCAVASMFQHVPGALAIDGAINDRINLDQLTVIVDPEAFERSQNVCRKWNISDFKTGERDCCAFVTLAASEIGLVTPRSSYIFPQDYLSELKRLNRDRDLRISPRVHFTVLN
jgi:hypothetical protein